MAFKLPSRVKETTVTSGSGTYALAGPVLSFRAFSAGLTNGDTCHYYVEGGADYEYGYGTYSANTLARTTIFKSSNSNIAVNWPAGTKTIGISEIGPSDLDGLNIGRVNNLMQTPTGYRNKIINGDFRINTRFGVAAATVAAGTSIYTLDRWRGASGAAPGAFTVQRALAGSAYYANLVVSVADASLTGADNYTFGQPIEGLNLADLNWGFSIASPITISFTCSANATYTLPISVRNNGNSRSWVGLFTVTATAQRVSITVPGDVTGTWLNDNGLGLDVEIGLGVGPTYTGVAGWQANNFLSMAGASNFMATLANNLTISDFQVEVGDVATAFERRSFDQELAMCQRYYQQIGPQGNWPRLQGYAVAGNYLIMPYVFPVPMRTAPTLVKAGTWTVTNCAQPSSTGSSANGTSIALQATASGTVDCFPDSNDDLFTCSAEL